MPGLFEEVRVRALFQPAAEYDDFGLNQRPPAVGDVGTLIDIVAARGLPDRYVVEMSGADARAIWLSEFDADEIEASAG